MTFVPRQHQNDGCYALVNHPGQYSIAEVCVAGGKSNMLGMLAWYYLQYGRVVIVAHNKELTESNAEACAELGLTAGICSASISTNAFARLTVGTIGTILNRAHLFQDVVAILIDEVHRVPPAKASQYRKLIEAISKRRGFPHLPPPKAHGLTATPFRADGSGGLEKTFGPIVFKYTFMDGLRDGYVKPIVPVDAGEDEVAANEIDVTGIKTVGDDYDLEELASRAIKLVPSHVKTVIDVMHKYNRRRVLYFCCNIDHVDKTEKQFHALGVPAVGIHSQSPPGKREKGVEAFKRGQVPILIGCNIFSTGFNVPDIDYTVMARATKSPVYYAQGPLGRGARITPYAKNCLLSDFGGNMKRHGTIDAIQASPGRMLECETTHCNSQWETWEHGRTCPSCGEIHSSAPKCKNCTLRYDQHYHGMKCPHCGQQQNELRVCAACEQPYASFLHPMCPHCGFNNGVTQNPGKDLKMRGASGEAINVKRILEAAPWQPIISPPVKNNGTGWTLTTQYATAVWPFEHLPPPNYVYLTRSGNGRYVAGAVCDVHGVVHQR